MSANDTNSGYYEFRVVQKDAVETLVRVPDVDQALPALMEHIQAFLIAAGFHQSTIDKYFEGENE